MEQIDVDRAMRRPEAYWYEDGLGEIATGLCGLLLALAFLVDGLGRAPFKDFVPISMMALALTGYWLGRTGVRAAKARWVFPRTGEIRYRPPDAKAWAIAFAMAGAVCWGTLLVLRTIRRGPLSQLAPSGGPRVLLLATALACLLLIVARDSCWQRRIVVVAGLAFLFGGLAVVGSSNETLQCSVLFGSTSLALVTSGAVAFRSYLRHAPMADSPVR
jgi:hypothetical protein